MDYQGNGWGEVIRVLRGKLIKLKYNWFLKESFQIRKNHLSFENNYELNENKKG